VVEYEAMRRALLGLPERQRAAIVLRFYEDLPETEVAEILRCRPGTVRSLVTRGVHAMRPDLERVNDE
jgi:RNA polymerase sigma factor (sigma-70 family)